MAKIPAHRIAMIEAFTMLMSGNKQAFKVRLKEAKVLTDKFYRQNKTSCKHN